MHFGKNDVAKKREKLTSSSSMVGKKAGVSALRVLFLSLIAVGFIGVCAGIGAFRGIIDNTPDISEVNISPAGQATFIYDADMNQVQKLTDADSGSNRISIPIDEIPLDMQHAIVAIEDERFYEHNGIDVRGILRAFVKGVTNGLNFDEGASTLTQQLLKNNVFTNWTNEGKVERFVRKFQEQFLALELEETLTAQGKDAKSVILENYLNTINLGAGSYGVQAASKRYFDKDAKDLTLSECTVLAAIPRVPQSITRSQTRKITRNAGQQSWTKCLSRATSRRRHTRRRWRTMSMTASRSIIPPCRSPHRILTSLTRCSARSVKIWSP